MDEVHYGEIYRKNEGITDFEDIYESRPCILFYTEGGSFLLTKILG